MSCPDDVSLTAYVQGHAARGETERVDQHLDGCTDCRRLLVAIARALMISADGEPQNELRAGDRVGRYLLLGRRGEGGMGTVWSAHDPELDRRIALKVTRGGAGSRWLPRREAQAMARLIHPNVVAIHDIGEHDGELYFAMDYVDGGTLAQWLTRPRTVAEIVRCFIAAGKGLAAAHAAAIVHGDFKADNVLVGVDGQVYVTDFGLARWLGEADVLPSTAGTPGYVSPEQHRGALADARSDQYAFCVALRDALDGRHPGGARPVPRRVRTLLRRGLDHDPQRRHPSMDELLSQLAHAVGPGRRRIVAVALMVGLGASVYTYASRAPQCEAAEAVTDVWTNEARERLLEANDAADASAALDGWAHAWTQAARDTCTARGLASHAEADGRASCLTQQLAELRGLLGALAQTDGLKGTDALLATRRLPAPSSCLDAPTDTPPVEGQRDVLEALAGLRGQLWGAQYEAVAAELPALRRRAEALDAPKAASSVRIVDTRLATAQGRFDDASALASAAVAVALEANLQLELREALVLLVGIDGVRRGRFDAGRRAATWAAALLKQPPAHPQLEAALMRSRASMEREAGNLEQAETLGRSAVELYGELHGEDDTETVAARGILASVLSARGETDEAITELEALVEISEREYGPEHPSTLMGQEKLAMASMGAGQLDRALRLQRAVVRGRRAALGPDHPHVGIGLSNLGIVLRAAGQLEDALAIQREALAHAERVSGPDDREAAYKAMAVANVLGQLARPREARPLHQRAVAILETILPDGHPDLALARLNLGISLAKLGDGDAARPFVDKALASLALNPGVGSSMYREAKAEARAALEGSHEGL